MFLDKKPNLTFVEIAAEWARELDEARKPGRPNRDEIFLDLLNTVWGGQLNDAVLTIEQALRDDKDGQSYKPVLLRFTREMLDKVVLVRQGARRRYPAASRWEFRTSLKLEDYDPGSLSAYVEPLTISKEDFGRWCDDYGHKHPVFWFGEQADAKKLRVSAPLDLYESPVPPLNSVNLTRAERAAATPTKAATNKMFVSLHQVFLDDQKRPATVEESYKLASPIGVGRDRARVLRRGLPPHLKNKRRRPSQK